MKITQRKCEYAVVILQPRTNQNIDTLNQETNYQ